MMASSGYANHTMQTTGVLVTQPFENHGPFVFRLEQNSSLTYVGRFSNELRDSLTHGQYFVLSGYQLDLLPLDAGQTVGDQIANAQTAADVIEATTIQSVHPNWSVLRNVTVFDNVGGSNTLKSLSSAAGWEYTLAQSARRLNAGEGRVRFTVPPGQRVMLGLDDPDNATGFQQIRHQFFFGVGGCYVREDEERKTLPLAFTGSESFEIAIAGGAIRYRVDDTDIYVSEREIEYPYVTDIVIYTPEGRVDNVELLGGWSS